MEMTASVLLAFLPCCEDSAARTPKTDFLYCSFWLSTLPHHFALLPIFFFLLWRFSINTHRKNDISLDGEGYILK